MQLDQVKALITGGVSGLGLAAARHLVQSGGQVLLLDINDEAGQKAVSELGANARYLATDVTDEHAVQTAVAEAVEWMGALNVAVNCAGIIGAGRVREPDSIAESTDRGRSDTGERADADASPSPPALALAGRAIFPEQRFITNGWNPNWPICMKKNQRCCSQVPTSRTMRRCRHCQNFSPV